jgi:hypothetical protein
MPFDENEKNTKFYAIKIAKTHGVVAVTKKE